MFKFIKDKKYWKLLLQNINFICFTTILLIYGMIIRDIIFGKEKIQDWNGLIIIPGLIFILSHIEYLVKQKENEPTITCPNCYLILKKNKDKRCYFYGCKCGYKYVYKYRYSLKWKWHSFWKNYYAKKVKVHHNKMIKEIGE